MTLARLHNALNFLKALGIASNDTVITVFVHLAVEYLSNKRLVESSGLKGDLLDQFQELAPDLESSERFTLNLRLPDRTSILSVTTRPLNRIASQPTSKLPSTHAASSSPAGDRNGLNSRAAVRKQLSEISAARATRPVIRSPAENDESELTTSIQNPHR